VWTSADWRGANAAARRDMRPDAWEERSAPVSRWAAARTDTPAPEGRPYD